MGMKTRQWGNPEIHHRRTAASDLINAALEWIVVEDEPLTYKSRRERAAEAFATVNSIIDRWELELPLKEFFDKYVKPAYLPDDSRLPAAPLSARVPDPPQS